MRVRSVWMTHGFDLDDPLVCEGIVGDGCGGGRIFFVEDAKLFAYDPLTQESIELHSNIDKNVEFISKKGCYIFLKAKDLLLRFNLQKLILERENF